MSGSSSYNALCNGVAFSKLSEMTFVSVDWAETTTTRPKTDWPPVGSSPSTRPLSKTLPCGLEIMVRDLLTQKCAQKKVIGFGYPRACRIRKHHILIGHLSSAFQLFYKMWLKLTKNEIFRFFWKISIFECYRSKTVHCCLGSDVSPMKGSQKSGLAIF
jgi:hypothetical protein